MPSLEAPRYYEHSKGIALGKYDPFFRWIGGDWFIEDTGEVDCPIGHVALVEVDQAMIDEYRDEVLKHWREVLAFEIPDLGWYVLITDSNGIIFAQEYGTGTLSEEGARADFAEAERTYSEWDTDDELARDEED